VGYEADAEKLARRAMEVAASICVYTNDRFTIETIPAKGE
jgi:ATP-dependent HslUV protease, peptidase subunit HslV